ncbi:MAG: NAD-glutamate dehydrogenase domain-containing protein, partial [Sphingomonadales bacterium]
MAADRAISAADISDSPHLKALAKALTAGALPGEVANFDAADRKAAAVLVLEALSARRGRDPAIRIESGIGSDGRRLMRVAVVNDDMPFLVDSIANAITAHGLPIDRILHPIVGVARDTSEKFSGFDADGIRTSLIYMETERGDALVRKDLEAAIGTALRHVRAAVTDWVKMKAAMADEAVRLGDCEGAALLHWFLDGNFTLLGSAHYPAKGGMKAALGITSAIGDAVLAPEQRIKAREWLTAHQAPMLVKSNAISTVHRHAPLDLIVAPVADGVMIHAGLWTSAALAAAPEAIPVLRNRLGALMAKYDFAPDGHAGKALAHALTDLPHDLLLAIDSATLERLTLTAMSLADRPRAELVLTHDALDRHMFAFVWLPRDELTTARRVAISDMIASAADGTLLSWSVDMGDDAVALIRYTIDRRQSGRDPDESKLRAALVAMVRGWAEAVEASLVAAGETTGATRMALRFAEAFPTAYRAGAGPDEAARDIQRLCCLGETRDRQVRLYRNADDATGRLRLKLYSLTAVTLSDVVPALENFGFRVVEEVSTQLDNELGHMHRFVLDLGSGDAAVLLSRAAIVEDAIASVLEGGAENDRFNELVVAASFAPNAVVLLRALFRYLRQTGLSYGLNTVVEALRRHPHIARAIIDLFAALHDPKLRNREDAQADAERAIERGLAQVAAIDEDRVLRLLRAVVRAALRTNFYAPAGQVAIAFKFDSSKVPGLPAPVPWREIWVYSPRVEGIHLRAGPVARGGLRWSDRRDDFRTEILGLMKAQRVKNAVIVPTGAKGGFFPKLLPSPAVDRDAWLAEGTESYRIFIRTLLSVTDNLVGGKVVHPADVVIRDGDDPYFVVAADKGTATFSDVANAIAIEHNFWLGDAFASGGSVGYDHKAMGITAKGAWISVQRHFAERGVDIQTQPIRVVGCGDMSGDVFGNGMLLSTELKIVAAFDHRHIFIDPNPDPASSWHERCLMFSKPRSSWADYDMALISKGGGVFPRSAKSIKLSKEARAALDIDVAEIEPTALISAILKSPVDLIWFGGIGTYVKAAGETHGQVGDPANDGLRVDAEDVRATAIGEGANLGVTQAARIAFSLRGGRINTDFIDNSAGVDCSDNEVNIKIALNSEVAKGSFTMPKRNALLVKMTDQVAELVLEDNRLQTLALSIAERGGASTVPSLVRIIETFETTGWLDRAVEGLPSNDLL